MDQQPTQPVQPVTPPPAPPHLPEPPVDPEQSAPEVMPEEGPSYSWQASEYIFHEKPAWWYGAIWIIAAILGGLLVLYAQWLSIAVVVAMALAVTVYSHKAPRTLNYTLDSSGISIDGKLMPFDSFKSYSVLPEVAWHEIDLEPAKRFIPRLTLLCETEEMGVIEGIMAQQLPRIDRQPDMIEQITRYLRF